MRGERPTILDIARVAGVSFKTVSRVLNDHPRVGEELRVRVQKAMADLDYQPNLAARALAGRRGYAIALLVDQSEFFNVQDANAYMAPYIVDLQAGALQACREQGYHFFVEPFDPHAPNWAGELRSQLSKVAIDGVVLAPPSADRLPLLEALESWGLPYVRIAPGLEIDRAPSVAMDEYGGTVAMTEHLLSLGHRRFAFVSGPDAHIAASVRLVAFRAALARWCTEHDEAIEPVVYPGDFTFSGGFAAGEALLETDRPTAIFAANDFMAAGVVAAATARRLDVPRHVSIAGFDDSAVARFVWPPLSTVRQPIRAMARTAIEHLIEIAAGRTPPAQHVEHPYELIERNSTGPVAAA